MSYDITASARLSVTVRCERCAHSYSYDVTESASLWRGTTYTDQDQEQCLAELKTNIATRFKEGAFGFSKCPSCGRLQSWMSKSREKSRRATLLAWSLILALALCVAVGLSQREILGDLGLWWVAIFAAVAAGLNKAANLVYDRIVGSSGAASGSSQPGGLGGPVDVKVSNPELAVWKKEVY